MTTGAEPISSRRHNAFSDRHPDSEGINTRINEVTAGIEKTSIYGGTGTRISRARDFQRIGTPKRA